MNITREIKKLRAIEPRSHPPKRATERRPWGGFDRLVLNELCSVKIMTILPGESLSLQAHDHHSEWWIVLDAALAAEVGGKKVTLVRGEDIFIPAGVKHRAVGLAAPCRWLEITFGITDESDIHRYQDQYGRADGPIR